MRTLVPLAIFATSAFFAVPLAASPCTEPDGAEGLPKALATPKELARKTLAPGKSFEAGPLEISLSKGVMPAYVGSDVGEAVVDGEVVLVADRARDGERSKNTASLHLPAVIRLGGYRVTFEETGKTALAAFDIKVDELGCEEQETGPPLQKGASRTMWLSKEGVSSIKLFEGDEHFSPDYFELYLTSGMSENANRKVVVDDAMRPLTPAWISLRAAEHNASGNVTGELDAIKINTPGSKFDTAAHRVEMLRVVHGPKTRLRFKEAYAPTDPVVSVLVRITRTK